MHYLLTIALVSYGLYVFYLIYSIIMDYDSCNPAKTIGWIFAVLFFPVIGIVCYTIIGRNLKKKASYYQSYREKFYDLWVGDKSGLSQKENMPGQKRLRVLIDRLSGQTVFSGNRIDIFGSAQEKFEQLFRDMEAAKDHIHILYYTILSDRIGSRMGDIVRRKVAQGVKVRIMYDDVGSVSSKKKFFRDLEKAGARVTVFSPVGFPRLLRRLNYRNHQKIVIIDGQTAYTGGINVADNYLDGLKWGIWRDTHFRIQGPAVHGLQAVFLADWSYKNRQNFSRREYFPELCPQGESYVQVLASEPTGENWNIMEAMLLALSSARKSVVLETPYFIPTECILTGLKTLALSGLDVRVILPRKGDSIPVQYATHSYISELLAYGVKVYLYKPGFLHSKLMVIDDETIVGGSSNMDIRSFQLNFECNVFVYDRQVAASVNKLLEQDMNDSELLTSESWSRRSKAVQFKEAFFRLLSPLL